MTLFDPQPQFAENDPFIHALLGLVQVNSTVDALIKLAVIGREKPEPPGESIEGCAISADETTLAVLGLISLHKITSKVVTDWANEYPLTIDSEPAPFGFEEIEDLLR